ncbi:2-hydroxyacyl-CoA lyase 1 [Smittium culicis]|uniref:2-hydroxyacyl-CoA lyase 1 n=2 Tax=Smittium culicis TaxID=133412 RepID=A0A1R1YR15_9FUNG|nr:2-hydroxyacyl-CoA lyase 1 [Smittium culicis]
MSETTATPISGAQYIARSLKAQGVKVVFGLVGIPVVEISQALINEGVQFIAFRHEQSACYAASAYGSFSLPHTYIFNYINPLVFIN